MVYFLVDLSYFWGDFRGKVLKNELVFRYTFQKIGGGQTFLMKASLTP